MTFEPFETDGDFEIYRNFKPVLDSVTIEDSIRFIIFKTPLRLNIGSSPPYIERNCSDDESTTRRLPRSQGLTSNPNTNPVPEFFPAGSSRQHPSLLGCRVLAC